MPLTTFVDDLNSSLQYDFGWTGAGFIQTNIGTINVQQHAATTAGLQASLSFTGTGVRVMGTLMASDRYGTLTTKYHIDGKFAGAYNAPFVTSDEPIFNVTFFSAQNLGPGIHNVLLENTNGTPPNTFYLDYFIIDDTNSISSASAGQTDTVVASVTTALGTSQTSATNTSNAPTNGPTHSTRSTSGVIAGTAAAGGAILVFVVLAFFCLRRRRRLRGARQGTLIPRDSIVTFSLSPYTPSLRHSINSSEMLSTRAVVLASHSDHRSATATLCEPAPRRTVKRQSELEILRPPATSALPGTPSPAAPSSVPSGPVARAPPPLAERSPRLSFPIVHASPPPSPPSLTAGTHQEATVLASPYVQGMATGAPAPLAELPTGVWHAPPESTDSAYPLPHQRFSPPADLAFDDPSIALRAADSGLRMYDDTLLPPPYTPD